MITAHQYLVGKKEIREDEKRRQANTAVPDQATLGILYEEHRALHPGLALLERIYLG